MPKKDHKELLERIQKRYTHARNAWKEIWDEGAKDMKYIAGDPWDEADKQSRKDAGRPALALDELNQYCNQAINNIRQNEPGIKVEPDGNNATSKTAEFRQDLIRSIEYASKAQRNAYTPGYDNALQRSYGFFRISREYVTGKFEQRICIKGIANPDTVVYDPDVNESDWSDANYCFVAVPIPKEEFKEKYPKAEHKDFGPEDMSSQPEWIRDDHIVVAEYFEAQTERRRLLLIDGPEGPVPMYEDELPEGMSYKDLKAKNPDLKERFEDTRKIRKYLTNGLEILEESEEPGTYIPIVPVIGKEIWRTVGGKAKRELISLVRLARDPYMMYCYLWTLMAEEAAQVPKTSFMGYTGQFETDREAWITATKIPHPMLQADPVVDQATGQVLPLPTRPQLVPNFQEFVVGLEAARRAIQAALGIQALPTAAQKNNEKSGVALERIENMEAIGSFHFTDNLHRALEHAGRIIDQWIPIVYDTERELGLRGADGSHRMVKINTPEPYADEQGQMHHYPVGEGYHTVTITTGPSYQSQRQDAADFLDTLIKNIENLPISPMQKSKLLALAIQYRGMGPLGDQMVEIINGDQNDPTQQLQQQMAQLQQAGQAIQMLQAELNKLQLERSGKVIENQFKMQMKQMDVWLEGQKLANQRAIAEISTKAQDRSERLQQIAEAEGAQHDAAHDIAMQKDQQTHESQQSQLAAQQAQQQQAQQPQDQGQPQ